MTCLPEWGLHRMMIWLSWALGHGTSAGRAIDEASELERDYGMAELLTR
jgi:hypothetical protein